ncbi:MAG: MFS transporter [Candidatus Latescibacteria bacterium]|nr:MFS transporter [Candidatus Latescibacterota bacterium]
MESPRPEELKGKATRIQLWNFSLPEMRTFHITWLAFFLCFFSWFGIAPLMAVVREELALTKTQIGNIIIASVSITVLGRLLIGPLCERFGPRLTYTGLLVLGALPVIGIGLSHNYETFLFFRMAIGAIGTSFVITQYHTSVMFAPNVVGTANATAAGWGNTGGGAAQAAMPLLLAAFMSLGVGEFWGWRLAMVAAGAALWLAGIAYYFLTQDAPEGNYRELRAQGRMPSSGVGGSFWPVLGDYRVWVLFMAYAACFGVELTIHNIAALYYRDYFALDLESAGLVAGLFGLMAIFARTLGGYLSDRSAVRLGLKGRVLLLSGVLLGEGLALMVFARMGTLAAAAVAMVVFATLVHMGAGATYGLVPFINKKALGTVAGIVGAGGNLGAVASGFLFRAEELSTPQALFYLGMAVAATSGLTLLVRFSPAVQEEEHQVLHLALAERQRQELAPSYGS